MWLLLFSGNTFSSLNLVGRRGSCLTVSDLYYSLTHYCNTFFLFSQLSCYNHFLLYYIVLLIDLRQEVYVFAGVYLSVCLSVCNITQKVMDQF